MGRDLAVLSRRVICFQRNEDNSICLLSVCERTSLALSILKRHVKSSHRSRNLALTEISSYFWFYTCNIYYISCRGFFRLDYFHVKHCTYFFSSSYFPVIVTMSLFSVNSSLPLFPFSLMLLSFCQLFIWSKSMTLCVDISVWLVPPPKFPLPNLCLFSLFLTYFLPRFIRYQNWILHLLGIEFWGQQDHTWFLHHEESHTSLLSFNKQRRMNSLTQSALYHCRPAHHCGFIPNIWSPHRPNSTFIILAAQHYILHCIKSLPYPYAITPRAPWCYCIKNTY